VPDKGWRGAYLRLHPDAALKYLEIPNIYHIGRDELYEINESALAFLERCNGTARGRDLGAEEDFVEYCLEEGLLEACNGPAPVSVTCDRSPQPSLRYLELQLLHRCNLRCRHCYLGPPHPDMMSLEDSLAVAGQFARMGGLRLMISGGEPLLYPQLKEFIAQTGDLKLRRMLITNGTLITERNAVWLEVENIQFSLDGWQKGHDLLRGSGSFEQTMRGIRAAVHAGIPISIATMIHRGNLDEFDRMQEFVQDAGATEWGIDALCMAGNLEKNRDLAVSCETAAPLLKYARGGGYHGSSDGFACGRHLMTVLPSGKAVKCGFYENETLGDARENLAGCWSRIRHIALKDLECGSCPVVEECAGGCRFRAPHPLAPDPVMCAVYGRRPP